MGFFRTDESGPYCHSCWNHPDDCSCAVDELKTEIGKVMLAYKESKRTGSDSDELIEEIERLIE